MASINRCFMYLFLVQIICFVSHAVALATSDTFSHHYDPSEHPLLTHTQFTSGDANIQPVVMRRYYLDHKYVGPRSALNSIYAPRAVSYFHYDSGNPFVVDADVFVPGLHYPSTSRSPANFGKIHLNHACRVFALMYSFKYFFRHPPAGFHPNVTGMPEGWNIIGAVRTSDSRGREVGDRQRWMHVPGVHGGLLAVEAVITPGETEDDAPYVVKFPHPWSMYMDGDQVKSISFVFVPLQTTTDRDGLENLQPFPKPQLPASFQPFPADGVTQETVHPEHDPPIPNHTCPQWLHDLHVVDLKDRWPTSSIDESTEPRYWRTWHPSIDPIYWCYYDHEHGSYPGKSYKPAFGYTAWKLADKTTVSGRQNESHEGFKVYFLQYGERSVVITLHLHISKARRFSARHHTVYLVVLRGGSDSQDIELEMSFKTDFGAAQAQNSGGYPISLDGTQGAIKLALLRQDIQASRIFNVLNIDENFPDSLDTRFRIKGDMSKGPTGILNGLYESWRTTLPSCTSPTSKHHGAFLFDVRDPSTAARFAEGTTDDNIQVMHGYSLRRVVEIRHVDIVLSLSSCFEAIKVAVERGDGVFFTDPYLNETFVDGQPGNFRLRQFIKPGFQDFTFYRSFLRANDPWSGIYTVNGSPGLQRIENAILRMQN